MRAPVLSTCYQGSQEEAVKGTDCKCCFSASFTCFNQNAGFFQYSVETKICTEVAVVSLYTSKYHGKCVEQLFL